MSEVEVGLDYNPSMHFLTPSQCDAWNSPGPVCEPSTPSISLRLPAEFSRLQFIAGYVATGITFREPCLLRVTESDIWGSSNNWHLYYRLRQSYGDGRPIDEAPGHLFHAYESEDFATFLSLAMAFGWDARLEPRALYVSGHLTHDGFLDLYSNCPNELAEFQKVFDEAKLNVRFRPVADKEAVSPKSDSTL